MMDKKWLYSILFIVAVIVIAASYFYFKNYKRTEAPSIESKGTVENLIDKVAPPNPIEKLPDTNPINKTNPFKNIKTNPFK